MATKIFSIIIIKPLWTSSGTASGKTWMMGKKCEIAPFVKKMLKFSILKCSNHSTTTRNYAVSFYKILEEVPWHIGLKELKKWQTFSKAWKNCEN